MRETFLSGANAGTAEVRRDIWPGALIDMLLREGLTASPGTIKQGSVRFSESVDWTPLCAVTYRCRIAPVIYQCLRAAAVPVPADVMNWFRGQYYETVARNMALLNDLRELLGWLSDAAVPAIVLKGPALAHLGLGAARVSYDLDILIHDTDLRQVDAILRHYGHRVWPAPPHDYHSRYSRQTGSGTNVVEVHFDISDRLRSYRPDIGGIWDRSRVTPISDLSMRVPDLSDHLLLTIMQLPHHHWAMRLMVDLWQVVLHWGDTIDWTAFLERAESWQMGVLTRSALHALWALFGVRVPPAVMAMSNPSSYFERVQWRAAKGAITEQLEHPFRPKVMWVVPYLMVDQVKRVPAILLKRSVGAGGPPDESMVVTTTRRNIAAIAALPAIGRVLLASLGQPSPRPGSPR